MCNPLEKDRNAAISSATFSILAILCAIIAAATVQFTLDTRTFGAIAGRIDFSLTTIQVTDFLQNGLFNSLSTYSAFIQSNCGGLCPAGFSTAVDPASVRMRYALQSAAGSGGGADFFYAMAIIALLIQTVSAISFACVAGKQPCCCCANGNPLPAHYFTQLVGIIIACVGFLSVVIAASISIGVYSGLAAAGLAYLPSSNAVWTSALW